MFIPSTLTPLMLTEYDTRELTAVRASLDNVGRAVLAAQSRLDAGETVDLGGMDARMERLCTRALALPPPLAQVTLPDLLTLLGTVDALIATLTDNSPR